LAGELFRSACRADPAGRGGPRGGSRGGGQWRRHPVRHLRRIAIRYEEDGETRILHLFLSVDDTSYWVGPEEEIPEDFAQLTTSFKDLLHATPRSLGVRSTSPSHLS
jgi:hypothetical protein